MRRYECTTCTAGDSHSLNILGRQGWKVVGTYTIARVEFEQHRSAQPQPEILLERPIRVLYLPRLVARLVGYIKGRARRKVRESNATEPFDGYFT